MKRYTTLAAFVTAMLLSSVTATAQITIAHDDQKEKQWTSMENGPWDFAPDWYYYFLHKNYSGAEMFWKWAGFNSGYRVRFKEEQSNVKRIMPVRVIAEETQRQKLSKVEGERACVESLYKEELAREADRAVDLSYSAYKEEFERMQSCIADGLLYCLNRSKGKMRYQVEEISRQNQIVCANVAYIRKTGIGYGLENAKRQQAYEEIRSEMGKLVSRTARLAAVAATHY